MLIYIIDDEIAPAYLLEQDILKVNPNAKIKKYQEQEKFLEDFKKQPADVVFLDIEMPGQNGIYLAKDIMNIKSDTNIIFCTGYSQYAVDAMNLFASGYMLKPSTIEGVKKVLNHLRFPVAETNIYVKTFGNFDIYINDKVVQFRLSKSKMLLAYLIDREGAMVTRKEAACILYEADEYSRSLQRDLCRTAQWLQEDLAEAQDPDNMVRIFYSNKGYYVDTTKFRCDLYDFLEDKKSVKYLGEYMEQYSFGEERKARLYQYLK